MKAIWPELEQLKAEDIPFIQGGLNLIEQGISIYDQELKLVVSNTRFREIYDIPEHLIKHGSTFEELVRYLAEVGEYGDGDVDQIVDDRVARAQMFEPHYLERKRPNGKTIAVQGNPLKDGGWVAVYTDVSDQKQHEALLRERSEVLSEKLLKRSEHLGETNRKLTATNRALEEVKSALQSSEERLQILNKSLPAHIAYLDKNYIYRFSNQRSAEVWGLQADQSDDESDDIVGRHVQDVYPDHIYAFVKSLLDQAKEGEMITAEYTNPSSDDPDHTIRVVLAPEKGAEGEVTGFFVLSIDVTDQRKMANSMLKTQRLEAITRLTGGLAHDLNNILTIILGNLSRLGHHLDESDMPDSATTVRSTQKAARQAARIMECLVAFSRRRTLEPRVTDLNRVLRDIYNLAVPNLSSQISLSLNLPDVPLTCFVDESAFQDSVINLLFNAKDALEGKGEITLSARKDKNNGFLVTIGDNGQGFAPDMLDKAFEPFATTKDTGAGTGLGLSMVQGFVLQSGGDIWIESVQGEGADVIMRLPAMESPGKTIEENVGLAEESFIVPEDLGPLLLVEDEEDIRAYLRHILSNAGFKIIEASTPDEGLELVGAVDAIELIVSDINMPGDMNGLDFVRLAKTKRTDIGIILLSGLAETDPIWLQASAEFTTLRKPFRRSILIKSILQTLKQTEPA